MMEEVKKAYIYHRELMQAINEEPLSWPEFVKAWSYSAA